METVIKQNDPRRISRFMCPECDYNSKIQVVHYDTIVMQRIEAIYCSENSDDVDVFYEPRPEYHNVGWTDYQCDYCGWVIPGVGNDEDLGQWLLEHWKEWYDEHDN